MNRKLPIFLSILALAIPSSALAGNWIFDVGGSSVLYADQNGQGDDRNEKTSAIEVAGMYLPASIAGVGLNVRVYGHTLDHHVVSLQSELFMLGNFDAGGLSGVINIGELVHTTSGEEVTDQFRPRVRLRVRGTAPITDWFKIGAELENVSDFSAGGSGVISEGGIGIILRATL